MPTESQIILLAAGAILAATGIRFFFKGRRTSKNHFDMEDKVALQTVLASCAADFPTKHLNERVTRFLTTVLGCHKLIFIRKKRGMYELAFYYGVKSFDRRAFTITIGRQLSERLRRDYVPRPVGELATAFPERFSHQLSEIGVTHFVPIYWRENLYGIYFFSTPANVDAETGFAMIASASSALAASYHTRWLENIGSQGRKKHDVDMSEIPDSSAATYPNFMRLVGHRNSKTIVPRMVESIQRDLNLNRAALVVESTDADKTISTVQFDGTALSEHLSDDAYISLLEHIRGRRAVPIDSLISEESQWQEWGRGMLDLGMTHLAPFSLTDNRAGIMAWGADDSPEKIGTQLAVLSSHAPEIIDNAATYQQLEVMSYTDPLTGIANQRYLMKRLAEEINRAARYQRQLALIMFDLDSLKKVNDTLGHLAGDEVLRQMGAIFKSSIRAIDLLARYGGDEFCIIMPEADEQTCLKFMERLRTEVASCPIRVDDATPTIRCTVSLGGAVFPQHGDDARKLLHSADMALLKAKEHGRNGFLLFGSE